MIYNPGLNYLYPLILIIYTPGPICTPLVWQLLTQTCAWLYLYSIEPTKDYLLWSSLKLVYLLISLQGIWQTFVYEPQYSSVSHKVQN